MVINAGGSVPNVSKVKLPKLFENGTLVAVLIGFVGIENSFFHRFLFQNEPIRKWIKFKLSSFCILVHAFTEFSLI